MAYVLGSLHILIGLFFAVHAIRTGRQMYWLIILFSFPMLGSAVYFLAEYLPSSKMERGVKNISNKAMQLLDPSRELREAQQAFELTPTIQNRMRLAAALDGAEQYGEAVKQFDACLNGPFANDNDVCFGAAKANFHVQKYNQSIALLLKVRQQKPDFRPEQIGVLLAQSYAGKQDNANARDEFAHVCQTYGSAETRAQYAIWAANNNDLITANKLRDDLQKDWQHWNAYARDAHKTLFNTLDAAINTATTK